MKENSIKFYLRYNYYLLIVPFILMLISVTYFDTTNMIFSMINMCLPVVLWLLLSWNTLATLELNRTELIITYHPFFQSKIYSYCLRDIQEVNIFYSYVSGVQTKVYVADQRNNIEVFTIAMRESKVDELIKALLVEKIIAKRISHPM